MLPINACRQQPRPHLPPQLLRMATAQLLWFWCALDSTLPALACREKCYSDCAWTKPGVLLLVQGKPARGPTVDVFGQSLAQLPREEVTCVHCGRRIAASR
jgi:hypothetical protein